MRYFLLVYDRHRQQILLEREYGPEERDRALSDRGDLQLAHTARDVEVVLFGARSYADLSRTHGRYFQSLEQAQSATAG